MKHVGRTRFEVKGVCLLFQHFDVVFMNFHLFHRGQAFRLLSEFAGEVQDLFSGSDQALEFALSFGIIFTRMDGHFDGGDVGLAPPVEAVEELEKILLGVLDSHGVGLF